MLLAKVDGGCVLGKSRAPICVSRAKKFAAFSFGFGLILYFPVFPPIKVVDIACLLAFFVFANSLKKPTRSMAFLIFSVLAIFFSTLINAFSDGLLTNDVILSGLSSVIALIAFLIVASMGRFELEAFIAGFLVSIVSICAINLMGAWGVIPQIVPQYHSVYGESSIGGMPDPSRYGFVLVIAVCFLLPIALLRKKRLLIWPSFFVVALTIIEVGQRSALIIALMVICLALAVVTLGKLGPNSKLTFRSNRLAALLITAVFTTSAIALLPVVQIGAPFFETIPISQKFLDRGVLLTQDVRAEKASSGFMAFAERPLIGHGFDGYRREAGAGTSHNFYIEVLVNGGAVATTLFLGFLILSGRQFYRSMRLGNYAMENWVVGGGVLTLIALSIYGLVINIHYLVAAYAVLGLIANKNFSPDSEICARKLGKDGVNRPT